MATLYSKVKLLDHPVHPMLVAFPITFFTTTLVAFVVYAINADVTWFHIGYWANVAGLVTALAAAIPGIIDWAAGIPKHSPAKRVGLLHMVLNLCTIAIFLINAVLQNPQLGALTPEPALAIVLSVIGVVLLLVSGYLGWSLVQTHHVGVDLTREQQRLEPRENLPHAP
jgi:uncharacterized membrane protein